MAFFPCGLAGEPPIGDEPLQKYPFVVDSDLNIYTDPAIGLGEEQEENAPERGSVFPDGRWYAGVWGHLSPESYVYITNGRLYSKTVSIHYNPWVWGGTTINQGRPPHIAAQVGRFKGSNTTSADAVYTRRIVFPFNETVPSDTLYLYARAKIVDRACMNYENPWSQANLGINLQFQIQYKLIDGTVELSDYDNPDYQYGRTHCVPSAVHFDIFLSQAYWVFGNPTSGGQPCHQPVGHENEHRLALADGDWHVQRVEGVMTEVGVWYKFKIDLGYAIERAKAMMSDNLYFENARVLDSYLALILRNIQVYTEASGGLIEAVVDTVRFYSVGDPFPITLNFYESCTSDSPAQVLLPTPVFFDWDLVGVTRPCALPHRTYTGEHLIVVRKSLCYRPTDSWGNPKDYYYKGEIVHNNCIYRNFTEADDNEWITFYYYTTKHYGWSTIYAKAGNILENESIVNRLDNICTVEKRTYAGPHNASYAIYIGDRPITMNITGLGLSKVTVDIGHAFKCAGLNDPFNPFSYKVGDLTINVFVDNTTFVDIILKNVPSVLKVEKNGLPLPYNEPMNTLKYGVPVSQSYWNYTGNDLIIRLYSGDMSEIFIDFETPFSLAWNVLIPSITVLIACLAVTWLYRRLREL